MSSEIGLNTKHEKKQGCIYVEDGVCEGCGKNKAPYHLCSTTEHEIHTGTVKACIDMFALPPHIKRECSEKGILEKMKSSRHICMIFTTEVENQREQRMRQTFVEHGIGSEILAKVDLKTHNEDISTDDCTRFWKYMVGQIDQKSHHIKHGMFKEILRSPNASVWYEEFAGLPLDIVEQQDSGLGEIGAKKASFYVSALVTFINSFRAAWSRTTILHCDLHHGNITYDGTKFTIIDYGYLNLPQLRIQMQSLFRVSFNDVVICLVNFSTCKDDIRTTISQMSNYPPEIVLFTSFYKDHSRNKGTTFYEFTNNYRHLPHMVDVFKSCLLAFRHTSPIRVQYIRNTFHELVQHAQNYFNYFQSKYKNTNFMYYIDKYQLARSIMISSNHWYVKNKKYLDDSKIKSMENTLRHVIYIVNMPLCIHPNNSRCT